MNPSNTPPLHTKPLDKDLVDQARPGEGVPSQDPDSAAQFALSPREAEREAKSVFMGGGMVAGIAAGAGVGVAVGGPVGAFVGGTLGAVAGALGGAAAGSVASPEDTNNADKAPPDPASSQKINKGLGFGN